jgi:hypothetical protein
MDLYRFTSPGAGIASNFNPDFGCHPAETTCNQIQISFDKNIRRLGMYVVGHTNNFPLTFSITSEHGTVNYSVTWGSPGDTFVGFEDPNGFKSITLDLSPGGASGPVFMIDDIVFQKVPEPASGLALAAEMLTLCAFLLLGRRIEKH